MNKLRRTRKIKVWKRDNFRCKYCGLSLRIGMSYDYRNTDITVDHVIAKSKGGSNEISNLVTACKDCNQMKGTLEGVEAVARIKSKKSVNKYPYSEYDNFLQSKGLI